MKFPALVAILGLGLALTAFGALATELNFDNHRKLMTIGPDDVAAVTAVGQAGAALGYSAAYATKKIAKAKKKEAVAEYRAKVKVANAMEDATRHAMKYADNPKKLAKYAAKDAANIAEAIAEAKEIKIKAKMYSMKVVAKTMGKVAEINLQYGSKAALAVGNAAINDVATFAPLLAGLAPKVLPKLASGLMAGPAGIQGAIGSLAGAIGGMLINNIGLEGPDLLANRISGLLPGNLLSSLPDMDIDVGAEVLSSFGTGGANVMTNNDGDLLAGIVANMPPQVLDLVTSFLAGNNPSTPPGINYPSITPGGDILIPAAALRAILQGVINLMNPGASKTLDINLDMPHIPAAGLPCPLHHIGNLMGVLPKPDLFNIFKLLPRPPLMGLLSNLPLGLAQM